MRKVKEKKSKKLWIGLGSAAGVILVATVIFLGMRGGKGNSENSAVAYTTATAAEGKISSTTLLSGTITASEEQYVYYESSKGDITSVPVSVGDQVTVGQVLVQYDTKTAQANYDKAVRDLNKVDRQINELKTYGVVSTSSSGDDSDSSSSSTVTAQQTYDSQMKDLQDARADASDAVNKAQEELNKTTIISDVNGTVVEVNTNVSSTTQTSQTVVHVVNNASLQVKGKLSEYNLSNIAVDQVVNITSKVYPDKTWSGKVSYISDYPSQDTAADSSTGSTSSTGSKYPFKVDFTSDLGELKQGFTVNVELVSDKTAILVPISAVLNDGNSDYVFTYDESSKKVTRTDVVLGSADATNQEISQGLNDGDVVISNPDTNLTDGQEVQVDATTTD